MLSDVAIRVNNISKSFYSYQNSSDRIKQALINRFNNIIGRSPIFLYKEFRALDHVSFEVRKGETIGVVGQNGSGKSTLLQIITGILMPNSGSVHVNGRIAALLELGSGFNFEFTGKENIYLNASILGLSKKEIDERYDEIIKFADIGDFINEPVKAYSSGMMVRLAFAVAINIEPDILIIDEALAVGDELFQRKCYSKIEDIKSKGSTILFVSHSASAVVELCDRAILMDSGQCLLVGESKSIVNLYQKLLYAPQDKKASVREEIKNNILSSDIKLNPNENVKVSIDDIEEKYDPNLKSTSLTRYEGHGVRIAEPKIETLEGVSVNYLVRGKCYKYKYKVKFEKKIENVRFGMLIKTIKGFELGGGVSSTYNNAFEAFYPDECQEVEFEFECSLNPGTYFLNSGVLGCINGQEMYVDRAIDIMIFKVLPEENLLSTCVVDFKCKAIF